MSLGIQTKTLSLPKALVYTWGDGGNKAKKKFSSYGTDLLVEAAEMNQAKFKDRIYQDYCRVHKQSRIMGWNMA